MQLSPSRSLWQHRTMGAEEAEPRGILEGLKANLCNGCNASETVRSLYLHRSTLLKHLSRAERILGMKLEGADETLYLQMCMRLIERKGKWQSRRA